MRQKRKSWSFPRLLGGAFLSSLVANILLFSPSRLIEGTKADPGSFVLGMVLGALLILIFGLIYGALFAYIGKLSNRTTVIFGSLLSTANFMVFTRVNVEDAERFLGEQLTISTHVINVFMSLSILAGMMVFYKFYLGRVYQTQLEALKQKI